LSAHRTWREDQTSAATAATVGVAPSSLPADVDDTGRVFASRYVLQDRIGSGGYGAVWAARDRLLGTTVALKLIPGAAAVSARRELAALRLILLPGVVRLLDDGEEDGVAWIAMERLAGHAFLSGSGRWPDVAEDVLGLLRTLAALHRLGIVHGDLKPANVMQVGGRGPVVLDFGISRGFGVEALPSDGAGGFSRGYAAPEQLIGRAPTPKSDIYALGVMLFEHLCGLSLRQWRMAGETPAPSVLAPGLPSEVESGVLQMLALEPAARPTAEALWEAWGGGASPIALAQRDIPWTEAELVSLFRGPERLLHLPTDAARELFERTQGEPTAVALELEAWERAGLAEREDGGLRVPRASLDRLAAGVQVVRADGTMAQVRSEGLSTADLLQLARADRQAGRRGVARIRLQAGLEVARRAGDLGVEDDLLTQLCLLEFSTDRTELVALALYAMERSATRTARREALAALAHAHLDQLSGARALAAVRSEAMAPFDDDELECVRVGAIVFGVGLTPGAAADAMLARWEPWSQVSPLRRAKWVGWRAAMRYRLGEMEVAAGMHLEAAKLKAQAEATFDSVLASRGQAATALLDASRIDQAYALALEVEEAAAAVRLSSHEAVAAWVRRRVSYVLGEVDGPDLALVEAAAGLSTREESMFTWVEGVIAWRTGHPSAARALLERAVRVLDSRGHTSARLLFDALGWALFSRDGAGADRILTEMDAVAMPPLLRLQVLGLLVSGRPELHRILAKPISELAQSEPPSAWERFREVLSVAEAVGGLGP
jgi:hypothetical protein